jgi:hypothetical protein
MIAEMRARKQQATAEALRTQVRELEARVAEQDSRSTYVTAALSHLLRVLSGDDEMRVIWASGVGGKRRRVADAAQEDE